MLVVVSVALFHDDTLRLLNWAGMALTVAGLAAYRLARRSGSSSGSNGNGDNGGGGGGGGGSSNSRGERRSGAGCCFGRGWGWEREGQNLVP